jgi:hypothetical protein
LALRCRVLKLLLHKLLDRLGLRNLGGRAFGVGLRLTPHLYPEETVSFGLSLRFHGKPFAVFDRLPLAFSLFMNIPGGSFFCPLPRSPQTSPNRDMASAQSSCSSSDLPGQLIVAPTRLRCGQRSRRR